MAPTETSLYDQYHNKIMLSALPGVTIMIIVDTVGIFANAFLILVTIKSKSLRETTNFLICFSSFSDIVHLSGHFYFAYALYTGKTFDDLIDCLHAMTVPLAGMQFGIVLIFLTAVDRLICILWPYYHKQLNKFMYCTLLLGLCFAYYAFFIRLAYINAAIIPETKVICLIVNAMHGEPVFYWSIVSNAGFATAIIIYAIIGVFIRMKGVWTLCSWMCGFCAQLIIKVVTLSPEMSFLIPLYAGIGINVSCSLNLFVLYAFSFDYRKAILSSLKSPASSATVTVTPKFGS
uniref:G_PROTEIN_RECEP_F1_2 domain-containing protein n=1 Tax=Panagrellus redivivus TaxID=6233 RepID=A0A7E4UXJ5_PANRE